MKWNWFDRSDLWELARNGVVWCFYVGAFYFIWYLALTNQGPQLLGSNGPNNWLDAPRPSTPEPTKVAGFLQASPELRRDTCLQIVDETEVPETPDLSEDFQKGFNAATEMILNRLEQK